MRHTLLYKVLRMPAFSFFVINNIVPIHPTCKFYFLNHAVM